MLAYENFVVLHVGLPICPSTVAFVVTRACADMRNFKFYSQASSCLGPAFHLSGSSGIKLAGRDGIAHLDKNNIKVANAVEVINMEGNLTIDKSDTAVNAADGNRSGAVLEFDGKTKTRRLYVST
jgi:hypothetical protein